MIRKSICKINLGLNIVERRMDGYHNIVTLMYPVRGLYDIIEVQKNDRFEFTTSGLEVDCPIEKNLCVKALRLMQSRFRIGEARIHLHKLIPTGAGLAGGSANATTVLMLCNDLWSLGLRENELEQLAGELGSDTPFFVKCEPQLATGRGEILRPFPLLLHGLWLVMVKVEAQVSTAQAYSSVIPMVAAPTVENSLVQPIETWRLNLHNDFEPSIFAKLPQLAQIKRQLYDIGAIYAAMSGSGSTIFGLFEHKPAITFTDLFTHCEQL